MLYLFDSNTMIDAKNTYYKLKRVPEFWAWLIEMAKQNKIKIPQVVYDEITNGTDELCDWLKANKKDLIYKEQLQPINVQYVADNGYGENLTEAELTEIGQDHAIISYGLNNSNVCIVSNENSKPNATRKNRKIPDVCYSLNVKLIRIFDLLDVLDFTTNWANEP